VAATAALLAVPATPARAACADADLQAGEQTVPRVSDAVLCLVNERRAASGLQPLKASSHLQRSATAHSRDMVAHGYLAHEADGRPTLLARVEAAGYFDGAATALFSENIGVAPLGGATAQALLAARLGSAHHRANILHPMFADLGVGAVLAEPDAAFYPDHASLVITTDFGQRVLLRSPAGRRIARRCRVRSTRRARVCRPRRATR
jgi:uncharacterized protein YkwD